jgi:hypothetical protein
VAGMPKYDANAERSADAYHRVPLPVKERDSAGSDIAVRRWPEGFDPEAVQTNRNHSQLPQGGPDAGTLI